MMMRVQKNYCRALLDEDSVGCVAGMLSSHTYLEAAKAQVDDLHDDGWVVRVVV
jgi:hypothetical protein